MNRDETIVLARAARNWGRGIAEVALVWRPFYSKLGVEYQQVTHQESDLSNSVPDFCVKNWLWIFTRSQETLQPDSYYITTPLAPQWRDIINILRP